jgi:hypothetical protein
MVSHSTLYTAEDIILSRLLASRVQDRKPPECNIRQLRSTTIGDSMYHQFRLGVGLRYCDTYHVLSRTVCRDGSQTTSGQLPYPRVSSLNGHQLTTHVSSCSGPSSTSIPRDDIILLLVNHQCIG